MPEFESHFHCLLAGWLLGSCPSCLISRSRRVEYLMYLLFIWAVNELVYGTSILGSAHIAVELLNPSKAKSTYFVLVCFLVVFYQNTIFYFSCSSLTMTR